MQKSESILSHAYLHEIMHYSITTGQFFWLKTTGSRAKSGAVAGTLHRDGYKSIKINGEFHLAHRLAWFYCTGKWPESEIDHVSGVRCANWWLNLREATRSQNLCNTGIRSNNSSGYKGVHWNNSKKKWRAYITLNKKQKHLGFFVDVKDAYAERLKAEKELFGDFARV